MKLYIYISLSICLLLAFSTNAQNGELIRVLGKVSIENSDSIVPFAFVANSKTGIGKETNERGIFRMDVEAGDTILFRCIGYEDAVWPLTDIDVDVDTIYLTVKAKNYALESIDVLWFRSYASFRHKVANMPIEETEFKLPFSIDLGRIVAEAQSESKAEEGRFGISFGAGSTNSSQRKYNHLLAEERLYRRYNKLTSHENLQAFTQLEGAKLDSFIVFLRTKHNIDPKLSEYDMMAAIARVFDDYQSLQTDSIAY